MRKDQVNEAATELGALLNQAFVPWHRVALQDPDLAPLWAHAETTTLPRAVAQAAAEWGRRVGEGVLLLSRLAAPIQLADGDGPLLFRPSQEVISWNPRTGRYHQVTSEGGRVLAFVRSAAGHEVLYITAQKVRRIGGRLIGFEGLGVHLLRLADMNLVSLRLPVGNTAFSRLTLGFAQGRAQIGAVTSTGEASTYAIGDKLFVVKPVRFPGGSTVVITPSSVAVRASLDVRGKQSCGFMLKPWDDGRVLSVRVVGQGAARVLPSRFGLGLNGLPLVQSKQ